MDTEKTRSPTHSERTMPAMNPRIPPAQTDGGSLGEEKSHDARTEPPSAFISPTSRRRSSASPAMAARTPKRGQRQNQQYRREEQAANAFEQAAFGFC